MLNNWSSNVIVAVVDVNVGVSSVLVLRDGTKTNFRFTSKKYEYQKQLKNSFEYYVSYSFEHTSNTMVFTYFFSRRKYDGLEF